MQTPSFIPNSLDQLLTLDEAARWLRMRKRDLSARSKGHNPSIPGIWINERVVRFHPRLMLAKMASDSGAPTGIVTAVFSTQEVKK